eukprot:9043349-Alexandrium_andersonii.AAC.1
MLRNGKVANQPASSGFLQTLREFECPTCDRCAKHAVAKSCANWARDPCKLRESGWLSCDR